MPCAGGHPARLRGASDRLLTSHIRTAVLFSSTVKITCRCPTIMAATDFRNPGTWRHRTFRAETQGAALHDLTPRESCPGRIDGLDNSESPVRWEFETVRNHAACSTVGPTSLPGVVSSARPGLGTNAKRPARAEPGQSSDPGWWGRDRTPASRQSSPDAADCRQVVRFCTHQRASMPKFVIERISSGKLPRQGCRRSRRSRVASCSPWVRRSSGCRAMSPTTRSIASISLPMSRPSGSTRRKAASRRTWSRGCAR